MLRWIVVWLVVVPSAASAAPEGTAVTLDRSVARVGEEVIWESDIAVRMRGREAKDRPAVVQALIDEALIIAEARRASITVDRSEVLAAVDEVKQQNKLDDAGLDAALRDYGYTRAQYMIDIERQLLRLRALNVFVRPRVMVTDADIEAEAKARKLALPLGENDKDTLGRELRERAIDTHAVVWLAELRARAWIEQRP
jgi:parvulin-like peptidyl-prolyl isomerase